MAVKYDMSRTFRNGLLITVPSSSPHNFFSDSLGQFTQQRLKLLVIDNIWWHHVNQSAEGAGPDAFIDEAPGDRCKIDRLLKLQYTDAADPANISDPIPCQAGLQVVGKGFGHRRNALLPWAVEQQVDAGIGDGAGQRVGHESRTMHESPGRVRRDRPADFSRGQNRSQAQIATGNRLSQADDVGRYSCVFAGKHFAGTAKTCGNFIGDQQNLEFVTQSPDLAKVFR